MKLLVIEDNRSLAKSLKTHLSSMFTVDLAHSGDDGLRRAYTGGYDMIVLDLHLPDKNGYDICKALRTHRIITPIIILTAEDDVASRVSLLNGGADDYLIKPFNIAELRARMTALLRRVPANPKNSVIIIEDLLIDPARRRVERAGVMIPLRRKEFDILEYLVRNRGRAVTRAMIVDHAWDSNKETWHNTVDVHIKHLRDKIDRPFGGDLIKTAYGIGYMIDDA
ncbi:MAG TPA: response regulator transcription factor [Candidatus Saccharimonadales bacterium]|nr:response regulator transcription factor [Candidatus Saccharimonadales bacterium]